MSASRIIVALLALLALTIAACGSDDGDEPEGVQQQQEEPEPQEQQDAEEEEAPPPPPPIDPFDADDDGLPDAYPNALVHPNATLSSGIADPSSGGRAILAVWLVEAEVDAILDFYTSAFEELEVAGTPTRLQAKGLATLTLEDDDSGIAVVVEQDASGEGTHLVTVAWVAPE